MPENDDLGTAEGWDQFVDNPEKALEVAAGPKARRKFRKAVLYVGAACQRVRDVLPESVRSSIDWVAEQADHPHRRSCAEPFHAQEMEDLAYTLSEGTIEKELVWVISQFVLLMYMRVDDDHLLRHIPGVLERAVWLRHAPRPATFEVPYEGLPTPVRAERVARCDLVRDIFGNPHRPVNFDPEWRTSTVLWLAQHMYDEREFGPMLILADALQDAGCADENILSHCRGPGPHVRGCWVVDLVLGKE